MKLLPNNNLLVGKLEFDEPVPWVSSYASRSGADKCIHISTRYLVTFVSRGQTFNLAVTQRQLKNLVSGQHYSLLYYIASGNRDGKLFTYLCCLKLRPAKVDLPDNTNVVINGIAMSNLIPGTIKSPTHFLCTYTHHETELPTVVRVNTLAKVSKQLQDLSPDELVFISGRLCEWHGAPYVFAWKIERGEKSYANVVE